jgi:hypothetical protein
MRRSGNTFSEVEFYRMISEPRDVASPKGARSSTRPAPGTQADVSVAVQIRRTHGPKDRGHCRRDTVESSDIRSGQGSGHRQPSCARKDQAGVRDQEPDPARPLQPAGPLQQPPATAERRVPDRTSQDRLPQLREANQVFKSHERRDDEGKLLSLQVRFNGLEFSKLKDANEYLRTVTLDSTTQLTVNGLDIPLAVSDALIKDELGTITDITAVRYNLAGEWFDVPRPEADMGMPSAQSLLTFVLRRGGDLPSKILETEATIQGNEATLSRLHTALDYESPYEAKLKEYEQRLAEIDKELLGKTEEVEDLSMLKQKNCRQ